MVEKLQAIKGMNDILPEKAYAFRWLESLFAACLARYNYSEIRTPLIEPTQLFKRSLGDITDVVEKEMYTFSDLNGESITLRPEGTAGCVRAVLEHGLTRGKSQKLWYLGPMFRHEKPQKGRYRQFHQLGVEVLNIEGVGIELELIAICRSLWADLNLTKLISLEVNTLGDLQERKSYIDALISYLRPHFDELDPDSQRRFTKNPLRILDTKNETTQAILRHAPKLIEFLSEQSRHRFNAFCEGLDQLGVHYVINPFLVRGLDYYGHTVFEWVTNQLGSQSTVCAGGRFDKLVAQLGGQECPAVGFALGIERLFLLLENSGSLKSKLPPVIYFIVSSDDKWPAAQLISDELRNTLGINIETNFTGGSLKSQFKKADKSGARIACILGDEEYQHNMIGVKDLREVSDQRTIPQKDLVQFLQTYLNERQEKICQLI